MKNIFFFCLILSLVYFLSCSDVKNKKYKESELTLLMREMFDEGMNIKNQVKNGEKPEITEKAKQLLSSHSTDPKVAMSEEYKLFAQSYLAAIEVLENANLKNRSQSYEIMVTTCMNCHRKLCPGPMVRIKKLYLD